MLIFVLHFVCSNYPFITFYFYWPNFRIKPFTSPSVFITELSLNYHGIITESCTDKKKTKKEIRVTGRQKTFICHDFFTFQIAILLPKYSKKVEKSQKLQNYNTPYSHVISHRSTDEAVSSLAAEIGRDPAFSASYGRSIRGADVAASWSFDLPRLLLTLDSFLY